MSDIPGGNQPAPTSGPNPNLPKTSPAGPSPAPASAAPASSQATPVGPAQPKADPTQPKASPAQSQASSAPQFSSENIGKWNARQADPFATQKQEQAAKATKKAEQKSRRLAFLDKLSPKLKIAILALGGVLLVGVIVFVIIGIVQANQPAAPLSIGSGSNEDINNFRDQLQNIFDQAQEANGIKDPYSDTDEDGNEIIILNPELDNSAGIAAIEGAINDLLSSTEDAKETHLILLSQAAIYNRNEEYQKAIDVALTIDPEVIGPDGKYEYYAVLSDSYLCLDDDNSGNYYWDLMNKAFPYTSMAEKLEDNHGQ